MTSRYHHPQNSHRNRDTVYNMTIIFEQQSDLDTYVHEDPYVDYSNAQIAALSQTLRQNNPAAYSYMLACFTFVRDTITHSWDAQDHRVTVTASQCLSQRTGICYAKANLFTALLRSQHLPVGFCYQRLTLDRSPESGYCIHTLNAVWYQNAWHRVDARGNKPGINAQFDLQHEQLAFITHRELDEIDYPMIYAHPLDICMNVLETSEDAIDMYLHHLPERLEEHKAS